MPDHLITVLVLTLVVGMCYILASPKFRKWIGQEKSNWRRRRAHEGKVECEVDACSDIAYAVTPNGYFCKWHWEPMSKKKLPGNMGYTVWSHRLNHSIRKS